jgi:sulfate/thiosulfate transport system ATP-binding protein
MTTPAITVRGANKRYGDFVALDNIDFEVPEGSLTALLGPSGSGKSTLLRAIAGLDQPDTGTITIKGQDVTAIPPQRRGIGFVFQHYAAFKHLTVRDNVGFGLKIRKRPKSEIKARSTTCWRSSDWPGSSPATPANYPAASVSGWRWPGRWRWIRRCCCLTSRSVHWTPKCVRTCGPGCGDCTTKCM